MLCQDVKELCKFMFLNTNICIYFEIANREQVQK